MKLKFKKYFIFLLLLSFTWGTAYSQQETTINRFFGLHFDFHATLADKNIGKTFDPAQIDNLLSTIKPDYIQVDTKGVHGISSYPTSVGTDAQSFDKDVLAIWRELTNKYNIGLYAHYTAIMDEEAIKKNPSWGRINSSKQLDNTKVSIFSNYNEELFIPQVKELIDKYDFDGIWVDGDSWALEPDYSPKALEKFTSTTGISTAPVSNADKDYPKFIEFTRREYRNYLRHSVDAIHSYKPDFKISNNWAYSAFMPEKLDVDLDFLSGDLSSSNWISNAAFQGRCIAAYKMPWDLMTWSFSDKGLKPLSLLCLEAAEVMSLGGGFQTYWQQNRDASINMGYMPLMKQLADFCYAREQYTYNSEIIPQVGVYFSNESWKKQSASVYNLSGTDAISGIVTMLLDGGNAVDVIMEHNLAERINTYPVVVIPEWEYISTGNKKIFTDYVNNGGNVLVMGSETVKDFSKELNVELEGTNVDKTFELEIGQKSKHYELPIQLVNVASENNVISTAYDSKSRGLKEYTIASINKFGRGQFAAIYFDAGKYYDITPDKVLSGTAATVLDKLFKNPIARITGPEKIHLSVTRKNGKQYVHLINVNNLNYREKAEYYAFINPVKNLGVQLSLPNKPGSIISQPEGIPVNFTYENGIARLTLPELNIYSILEVE